MDSAIKAGVERLRAAITRLDHAQEMEGILARNEPGSTRHWESKGAVIGCFDLLKEAAQQLAAAVERAERVEASSVAGMY